MRTTKDLPLDFEIDKLTNSIGNTSTGEVFDTLVVRLTSKDLGFIHKSEWQFDWSKELSWRGFVIRAFLFIVLAIFAKANAYLIYL